MTALLEKFLSKIQVIKNLNPKRREPGDGSDGYCDCIGLIIGAIRRCGLKWTGIHGSNWAARKEVTNLHPIKSETDLEVGDIVLRGCQPGESGYALPSRYKKGGQYYNGDLTDYYHAGVVTKLSPLNITHMATRITVDTKIGRWNYAGRARILVNAGAYKEAPTQAPAPTPSAGAQAKVIAESGNTVNMRNAPSLRARILIRIKLGTIVNLVEPGEEWCRISYGNKTGYMMAKFLEVVS